MQSLRFQLRPKCNYKIMNTHTHEQKIGLSDWAGWAEIIELDNTIGDVQLTHLHLVRIIVHAL